VPWCTTWDLFEIEFYCKVYTFCCIILCLQVTIMVIPRSIIPSHLMSSSLSLLGKYACTTVIDPAPTATNHSVLEVHYCNNRFQVIGNLGLILIYYYRYLLVTNFISLTIRKLVWQYYCASVNVNSYIYCERKLPIWCDIRMSYSILINE